MGCMGEIAIPDREPLRAKMREQILNCLTVQDVVAAAVADGFEREIAESELETVLVRLQNEATQLTKERTRNIGIAIAQYRMLAREALADRQTKPQSRRKEVAAYLKEIHSLQGLNSKGPMAAFQINLGTGIVSPGNHGMKTADVIRELKMQGVEPELIKEYEATLENDSSIIPVVNGQVAEKAEELARPLRGED